MWLLFKQYFYKRGLIFQQRDFFSLFDQQTHTYALHILLLNWSSSSFITRPRTFFLDPIGDDRVTAVETRSTNDVKVFVNMNKGYPNATIDFKGNDMFCLFQIDTGFL